MDNVAFLVQATNALGSLECLYRIEIFEQDSSADITEDVLATNGLSTHAQVLTVIESRLNSQRAKLLRDLESVDYNLNNLETLYELPAPLLPQLQAEYATLVQNFEHLKTNPGNFQMHELRVSNKYLSADSELFVMELPEYASVRQSFTPALCEHLLKAMEQAGLIRYSDWNGIGHRTWSVRARPPVTSSD